MTDKIIVVKESKPRVDPLEKYLHPNSASNAQSRSTISIPNTQIVTTIEAPIKPSQPTAQKTAIIMPEFPSFSSKVTPSQTRALEKQRWAAQHKFYMDEYLMSESGETPPQQNRKIR